MALSRSSNRTQGTGAVAPAPDTDSTPADVATLLALADERIEEARTVMATQRDVLDKAVAAFKREQDRNTTLTAALRDLSVRWHELTCGRINFSTCPAPRCREVHALLQGDSQ
jgi:hypothetical protein